MNFQNVNWKQIAAIVAIVLLLVAGIIEPGTFIRTGEDEPQSDAFLAQGVSNYDDLELSGGFSIDGLADFNPGSTLTVTNGAAFTPVATYQPITAAGEVTPTITVLGSGVTVCIENTSANTINVVDSGTAKLSAAWAGGQYDTLCVLSDGTNWIEVSRSNN